VHESCGASAGVSPALFDERTLESSFQTPWTSPGLAMTSHKPSSLTARLAVDPELANFASLSCKESSDEACTEGGSCAGPCSTATWMCCELLELEEAALAHAAQLHGCAASSWSWRKLRWPMQLCCRLLGALISPGATRQQEARGGAQLPASAPTFLSITEVEHSFLSQCSHLLFTRSHDPFEALGIEELDLRRRTCRALEVVHSDTL